MKNEKKSRPGDCSTRTAAETGTACETASSSALYDTTLCGGGQTGIASLLMHGACNGLTLRDLKALTGLKNRDLRRRIQMERLSGIPILSDCKNGYFLPDSPAEVKRFAQGMNRRADEIRSVAAAVEKGMECAT